MDAMASIRHDVQQGQTASIASIHLAVLPQDWPNELLHIFQNEVMATDRPPSTPAFVSYLKRLTPYMDASRATSEYWNSLLRPILISPEGIPSASALFNDVIACCVDLMSRNSELVRIVMNDYLEDRHRALEGRRINTANNANIIESPQVRNRTADVAVTLPYWESRTGHNLEKLLISWASSSPTPQEFFELVAEYAARPEQRLYTLTFLLPFLQSAQDLQLRTIVDTPLFDLIISCAMHESHPGLLSTSLAALTYTLPAIASRIVDRLDRLMMVLLRILYWEADFGLITSRLPEIVEASPAPSLSGFPVTIHSIPIKQGIHSTTTSSVGWDAQRLHLNLSPTTTHQLGTFGGRRRLGGTRRGTPSGASSEAGEDFEHDEYDDDSSSDRRKSVASSDIKLDDDAPQASQYIQKLLSASTNDILHRRIDDYFTILYGLYPCALMTSLREWQGRPHKVSEDPSIHAYEPSPNPFVPVQVVLADMEVDPTGHVKQRLTVLIRSHRMHQNLLFHTQESERASLARFIDTTTAQIAASCFDLRSPMESTLDTSEPASKHSIETDLVGINTIYEVGSALRKALRDIPHHAALIVTPTSPIPIPKPTVASHPDALRLHVLVLLSDLYMERAVRSRSIQGQVQNIQTSMLKEDEAEGLLNLYNHIQKQRDEIAELKRKDLIHREENAMIRERARKHEERFRQQLKIAKEELRLAVAREKETTAKLSTSSLSNPINISVASTQQIEVDAAQRIFELENEVASMTTELNKLKESEAQLDATVRRLGTTVSGAAHLQEHLRQTDELHSRIHELELQVEDSEREITSLKKVASDASTKQESLTAQIHHLMRSIEIRDKASDEQTKIMAQFVLANKEQLNAAEDRYVTVKSINAQMEARLVDLWNRVDI
ncbi:hypothetical protein SeMB42_g00600 [Synchytrium endobioticum]|uniref:Uncharacterized protein n=1 Tax=Synchytrium endobioticum TaxID=286115 RepID=A0A507DPZ3_9FUNG|nr:hypothetical protein SeLEV6574_g01265 [Synchytrium endobioticum]TPX53809.1 hypothetical protein SeMB42_g00600 [Synchytrium endobioticum]